MGMVMSLPVPVEAHERALNEALAYSSTEPVIVQHLDFVHSEGDVHGMPTWQRWVISIGAISFIMITGGSGVVYFRLEKKLYYRNI